MIQKDCFFKYWDDDLFSIFFVSCSSPKTYTDEPVDFMDDSVTNDQPVSDQPVDGNQQEKNIVESADPDHYFETLSIELYNKKKVGYNLKRVPEGDHVHVRITYKIATPASEGDKINIVRYNEGHSTSFPHINLTKETNEYTFQDHSVQPNTSYTYKIQYYTMSEGSWSTPIELPIILIDTASVGIPNVLHSSESASFVEEIISHTQSASPIDLSALTYFKQLRTLSLKNKDIRDLEPVVNAFQGTIYPWYDIVLSNCKITNDLLRTVSFESLKFEILDLSNNRITDIRSLKLPKGEVWWGRSYRVDQKIILSGNQIITPKTNGQVHRLNWPSVTSIDIRNNQIDDLTMFFNLNKDRFTGAGGYAYEDSGLRRHGRRFNGIYLSGNPVADTVLELRADWVASSHNTAWMGGSPYNGQTKAFAEKQLNIYRTFINADKSYGRGTIDATTSGICLQGGETCPRIDQSIGTGWNKGTFSYPDPHNILSGSSGWVP